MTNKFHQISTSFADAINEPLLLIDHNLSCITVNKAFTEITNLSNKKANGKKLDELLDTELINLHLRPRLNEAFSGNTNIVQVPGMGENQKNMLQEVHLYPQFNEKGKVWSVLLLIKNQKPNHKLFSHITEYSDDLVYMMDNNQVFTYFSSSIEKLLGYKPSEAVGMHARDILTEETYQYQLQLFKKHAANGKDLTEPTIMRGQLVHKNGQKVWGEAHARIIYNDSGEPAGAFGILRDITEKLKSERELIESKKKLNLIAENSDDMIYASDMNQNFTYFSPSVEKLLGYTQEEALNLHVRDIMTKESYNHQLNLLERDLSELQDYSEGSVIIRVEMVRKDGSTFWGETYARIIVDEGKNPVGIYGICRDITIQKERERKLKESREEYKLLAEHATDMIYMVDLAVSQNFKYVSPSIENLLGYTQEEAKNLSAKEMLTPESFVYQNELLEKRLRENTDFSDITESMELKLVRKDGRRIWGEAHARIVTDDKGQPVEIIGIMRDITERKKYEKALQTSEEKFRNIFNNANDAIFIVSSEGDLLDVNEIALERFHYTKEEFLKLRPYDWTSDKYQKKLIEKRNELLQKRALIYETEHITKEGNVIPTEVNARFITFNGRKAILAIARDITQRKLAEQKEKSYQKDLLWLSNSALTFLTLNSEAAIYEYIGYTLSQKIRDAIFIVNKVNEEDEHVTVHNLYGLTNHQFQKVMKILGGNVVGKEFQLIDPLINMYKEQKIFEFDEGLRALMKKFFTARQIQKLQKSLSVNKIYTIGLRRGERLFAAIHIFKLDDKPLEEINLLETFFNQASIALQRKILEQELIVAKEKAEESDRLKSAFLTNMSHEVRTPLNIMMGYLQMFEDSKINEQERKNYLSIIQNSSNQLLNIINDILNMAKLETGQISLEEEETDINDLLYHTYNSFKKQASEKGLNLSYHADLPNHKATIFSDAGKIQQVLTNLISNSLKFTHDGSIRFGYCSKENELIFFVQDTGIGIPEGQKEKIFERFSQAEQQNNRIYEGTGLGLSISKAIIEFLNGKIWVEDNKNQGSCFYFTLPYKNPTSARKAHSKITRN